MKRVWTQIDPPKINVAGSCACIHTTAAGSDSSRRFCSVTAVVCRRFSHMTAEGGGGASLLLPAVFGARWRLQRCCWYPWCMWINVSRRHIGSMAMHPQWPGHSAVYVACHGGTNVTLTPSPRWRCSVVTRWRCVVVKSYVSGCFWKDLPVFGRPGWAVVSVSCVPDEATAASCKPK